MQRKLFSVMPSEFRVDTFRGSGAGGQNRNKRDTAVRITHLASGAVGQSAEERQQLQNKKTAFRRLVDTQAFRLWVRLKAAAVMKGFRDLEEQIVRWMRPENLKVEELLSYTCDGCGARVQLAPSLPEGWSFTPPDTHYCLGCTGRRRAS